MRKTINKIVSGLITLTLLLSLTPVAIFAEEDVDKQPVETSIVETTKETTKETKAYTKKYHSKKTSDYYYDGDIIADKLMKKYGNNLQGFSARNVEVLKFLN